MFPDVQFDLRGPRNLRALISPHIDESPSFLSASTACKLKSPVMQAAMASGANVAWESITSATPTYQFMAVEIKEPASLFLPQFK